MCTRFSAIFFGDSLSKYRKMPTGKEKKRTPSKLRSLVCNKAENGVCCDEPTLIATLQVELFFNVLVVVSLRPENRGSRRAITRDGRPAPRGTLPAGKGGFPALPRTVGRGRFPAPSRENDQNRGEAAGQNKGLNLNFLQ